MNMKINKIIKTLLIAFLLQFFSYNLLALDEIKIEDEEMPATDPFASTTPTFTSEDNTSQNDSNITINKSLKLNGIVIGANKGIAIFTTRDGRNIKVLEGDSFQDNMQLIEIINDEVVIIEINEQMYEYYMNGEIKISDG